MSSPVCLSTVLVLRCIGISREESALLLIPAGLEMVFSIGILVAGRGQGRRRFIIALEGLIYVFLAVLDVFTHLVSTFQSSLQSFKVLDIIIASFIPLLLFTSFLYLFKRAEFFPAFPKRFTFVASFFAVIAIPVLLVTSEIGSFIGNDYVTVQFDTIPPSPPQFAVGTTNQAAEVARLFFSSLALALMAAYAVITFLIFFVRLSASFVNQRRIEDDGGSQEETYLFKGTGWIALGLTFAAAESLAGFATGSFGLFFTRRVLRMLSRACVAIGVVKGPDRRLKFDMLDNEKRGSRRKSTMRLKIGAPLLVDSTRRISQLLGIDLTKRRDSVQSDTVVGTAPFGAGFPRPSDDAYRGGSQFPMPDAMSPTNSSQRVTIFMRHGRAPTLLLRLSDPGLPSPNAMFRHSPSNRSSSSSIRQGHADADLTIEETVRTRPGSRSSIYSAGKSLAENFRTQAYRNMKGGLPSNPRVGSASNSEYGGLQMPIAVPVREARVSFLDRPLQRLENMLPSPTGSAIPRRTSKRKAPPPVRASMYNDSADFVSPVSPREVIEFPRVPDSARRRMHSTTSNSSLGRVRGARDSRDLYQSPDTATSPRRSSAVPRSQRSRPTTTSAVSAVLVDPARAHSLSGRRSADHVRPASLAESPEDHRSALARGSEAISFDWLTDPEGQNGAEEWATRSTEASPGHARSSSQVLHSMPSLRSTPARTQTQRQSPRRNVSFGVVSRRQTPTPSPAAITRASVDVERLTSEMDASSFNNASSQHNEYHDTSESTSMADSASISSWGPQRDSEVLTLNPSQLMERYGEAA